MGGQWLPWLAGNFEFSPDTANDYMRVAKRWAEITGAPVISIRGALALLAAPGEAEPAT